MRIGDFGSSANWSKQLLSSLCILALAFTTACGEVALLSVMKLHQSCFVQNSARYMQAVLQVTASMQHNLPGPKP